MNLETFLHLVDRVGAPMAILGALVYLLAAAINGPGMRVAEIVGGTLAELVKNQVGQLATREHVSREHAETRATVEREHAETRATTSREAEATRTHVTTIVGALRDRVSDAEHEVVGAVLSGRASQLPHPIPPPLPSTSSASAMPMMAPPPPRPPAPTLPSAPAPPAATTSIPA